MSIAAAKPKIDRKQQILQQAIEIIVDEGYARLSMRALAKASGIKLGALQYHFPTWESLLIALKEYIWQEYQRSLILSQKGSQEITIVQLLTWYLDDSGGDRLQSDYLWPQLWAMGRVEPVMQSLLDDIYRETHSMLEQLLRTIGSESPDVEALALMSMAEGSALFVGEGRVWESHGNRLNEGILKYIEAKYGTDV